MIGDPQASAGQRLMQDLAGLARADKRHVGIVHRDRALLDRLRVTEMRGGPDGPVDLQRRHSGEIHGRGKTEQFGHAGVVHDHTAVAIVETQCLSHMGQSELKPMTDLIDALPVGQPALELSLGSPSIQVVENDAAEDDEKDQGARQSDRDRQKFGAEDAERGRYGEAIGEIRRGHGGEMHDANGKSQQQRAAGETFPIATAADEKRQASQAGARDDRRRHALEIPDDASAQFDSAHAGEMHRGNAEPDDRPAERGVQGSAVVHRDENPASGNDNGEREGKDGDADIVLHRQANLEAQHRDEMSRPDADAHCERRDRDPHPPQSSR